MTWMGLYRRLEWGIKDLAKLVLKGGVQGPLGVPGIYMHEPDIKLPVRDR